MTAPTSRDPARRYPHSRLLLPFNQFGRGQRIAAGAFLLNIGAAGASFISTLILARTAGASVVGHYALAMATISVLSVLALLGLDRILIRTMAGDLRQGLKRQAHGALLRARRLVAGWALVIGALYLFALEHLRMFDRFDSDHAAMVAGAGAIFVVAMLRMGIAAMRGSGRQLGAQALDSFATLGFAVVLLGFLVAKVAPTGFQAVVLFVGLQALAGAIAWWVMGRDTARWGPPRHDYSMKLWAVGMPLMLVVFVHLAADWLLISTIARHESAASVGAFRVALQIISLPALVTATAETYYSPLFAGDFRAGRVDLAWARQRRASRVILLTTGPLLLLVALFAGPLLGTIFGPEFLSATPAMQILAAGQLAHVLTGPAGGMLTMAGRERSLLVLALCGMAALLTLSSVLVPLIGLQGAAIAWAVNICIRSVGAYAIARRVIPRMPA